MSHFPSLVFYRKTIDFAGAHLARGRCVLQTVCTLRLATTCGAHYKIHLNTTTSRMEPPLWLIKTVKSHKCLKVGMQQVAVTQHCPQQQATLKHKIECITDAHSKKEREAAHSANQPSQCKMNLNTVRRRWSENARFNFKKIRFQNVSSPCRHFVQNSKS